MDGGVRLRRFVSVLLVLVMLGSAVTPAIAVTETTDEILLKRAVVASLDEKGKLSLNITWINKTINLNMSCANGNCSCENDTCPAMLYNVDVEEVYNFSKKGKSLKLMNITVYNDSFSYSFYVLNYRVEKQQYNLTVVTRIMPINDTNLFTTVVNIDPRDDKAVPVADMIFFTNETTLADHYRLLGDVLNEVRKKDETRWVWNKAKIGLNYLSRVVERDLTEYNVDGTGIVAMMDGTNVCSFPLNPMISVTFECLELQAPYWVVVGSCCASLYAVVIVCTLVCIESAGLGCIGCISGGVLGAWASLSGCYGNCPVMNVCVSVLGINVACSRLW